MPVDSEVTVALDDQGIAVIALKGEHDVATADGLRAALAAEVTAGRPVLVDLTGARFVDSTILGVLLKARKDALAAGTGFASVLGPEGAVGVQRIFDVTGLRPVLPLYDERADALAALRA
jgi:anti-sigma B factor antagonist